MAEVRRLVGRNVDGEDVFHDGRGRVVAVGGTRAVARVRPMALLAPVPSWARLLQPHVEVAQGEDGRLLCESHCGRWRSRAELVAFENACPIGLTLRPGALRPLPDSGPPAGRSW
ncbi:hypothetical protein ACLQ2R_19605 [Streptosporangium sp. DT93]|uniref:hypothetical protein n=1 Tax=Streptosporangium sp. DT93 TaxID=3393428 RepID=UPI003CEB909B